jgi:hypothetical protein
VDKMIINFENEKFENYGDINPLQHGGIFIKQIGETEYHIVTNDILEDMEGYSIVGSSIIDITDSWIDIDGVKNSCGITVNNKQLTSDILWYYGHYHCNGEQETIKNEEVIEYLKKYGIEIEE